MKGEHHLNPWTPALGDRPGEQGKIHGAQQSGRLGTEAVARQTPTKPSANRVPEATELQLRDEQHGMTKDLTEEVSMLLVESYFWDMLWLIFYCPKISSDYPSAVPPFTGCRNAEPARSIHIIA